MFWRLKYSPEAVDTRALTRSFGWSQADSFIQNDVQEFAHILLDNLEQKMDKSESTKGTIKKLFEGVFQNCIECVNVKYSSTRSEAFMDLQLNVRGCKNLIESFDQYCAIEMLDGNNQYSTEDYGMQDARKGIKFESLPPVLLILLKRFQFDVTTGQMCKVNDRLEYPVNLNLSKYCTNPTSSQEYALFSVLVHNGGVSGGHYWAYIRPSYEDKIWFKFDDEKVFRVSENEAIYENFGGEAPSGKLFKKQVKRNEGEGKEEEEDIRPEKHYSAYYLVYIKKSEINEVLKKIDDREIPDHVSKFYGDELKEEEDAWEENGKRFYNFLKRSSKI